jgi:hypothetical protein
MITDKYPSITTPDLEHDQANILVEFIWLNRDLFAGPFPWKNDSGSDWGKMVAAVKKLMKEPYGLTAEQIAFYIWRCKPHTIDSFQFAKMAVVARKLFRKHDLESVHRLYLDRRRESRGSGLENAEYKKEKPKSLLVFLRELERGETN